MGIAQYNRGTRAIERSIGTAALMNEKRENRRLAIKTQIEVDKWRREAMAYVVTKQDAGGFIGGSIAHVIEQNGKIYQSRRRKVIEAHSVYIDADMRDVYGFCKAATEYAAAYWRLLDWMTRGWKCPIRDNAPRCIKP